DRIVLFWLDGLDAHCAGFASWPPRFSSREAFSAPGTGTFDDAASAKSVSSVVRAFRAATSTRGRMSMRIGAHAARSNIHVGNSNARYTMSPSRLHRAT